MKTYKEELAAAMAAFAEDPLARFVGYGLARGRAAGSMAAAKEEQIVELPVAENLLAGVAIGLSLRGKRPLVYIERADFLLNALDAIVNHLDKMATISRGEFRPGVIFRIVVGNSQKPLFTGPTHCQNFAPALRAMVGPDFAVRELRTPEEVREGYAAAIIAQHGGYSTALFEFKDLI